MNSTAMRREYQKWCCQQTGIVQDYPPAGPMWDCWFAAWSASHRAYQRLKPLTQAAILDMRYASKTDVEFARRIEDALGVDRQA